jgi:hypothetical protein
VIEAKGRSERILFPPVERSSESLSQVCSEDPAEGWQSITDKEFFSIDFWGFSMGEPDILSWSVLHSESHNSPAFSNN